MAVTTKLLGRLGGAGTTLTTAGETAGVAGKRYAVCNVDTGSAAFRSGTGESVLISSMTIKELRGPVELRTSRRIIVVELN